MRGVRVVSRLTVACLDCRAWHGPRCKFTIDAHIKASIVSLQYLCFKICMVATRAEERAKSALAGLSYGEVETAIARVLKVEATAQARWMRGRIQHLRR